MAEIPESLARQLDAFLRRRRTEREQQAITSGANLGKVLGNLSRDQVAAPFQMLGDVAATRQQLFPGQIGQPQPVNDRLELLRQKQALTNDLADYVNNRDKLSAQAKIDMRKAMNDKIASIVETTIRSTLGAQGSVVAAQVKSLTDLAEAQIGVLDDMGGSSSAGPESVSRGFNVIKQYVRGLNEPSADGRYRPQQWGWEAIAATYDNAIATTFDPSERAKMYAWLMAYTSEVSPQSMEAWLREASAKGDRKATAILDDMRELSGEIEQQVDWVMRRAERIANVRAKQVMQRGVGMSGQRIVDLYNKLAEGIDADPDGVIAALDGMTADAMNAPQDDDAIVQKYGDLEGMIDALLDSPQDLDTTGDLLEVRDTLMQMPQYREAAEALDLPPDSKVTLNFLLREHKKQRRDQDRTARDRIRHMRAGDAPATDLMESADLGTAEAASREPAPANPFRGDFATLGSPQGFLTWSEDRTPVYLEWSPDQKDWLPADTGTMLDRTNQVLQQLAERGGMAEVNAFIDDSAKKYDQTRSLIESFRAKNPKKPQSFHPDPEF